MTIGIGMYAPIRVVISLMGMNPDVAFPIMMGTSPFLMPVAGLRFRKTGLLLHADGGAGAGDWRSADPDDRSVLGAVGPRAT